MSRTVDVHKGEKKNCPHLKKGGNPLKHSYTQTYPHYPHKLCVDNGIYIKSEKTNVLGKNHKST